MMIRNIWAVGRNYADHNQEMKAEAPREPMIFLKAGSCATVNSTEIVLPYWSTEVHHEVELALKLNASLQVIEGAVALDLTERQIQAQAKAAGNPWTLSKSFSGACAISAFFSLRKFEEMSDLRLRLWVNDELRQDGKTSQMLFSCEKLMAYIYDKFPMCAGDVILTGTPRGVGLLKDGDRVKAEIEGHITHNWKVVKEVAPPVSK